MFFIRKYKTIIFIAAVIVIPLLMISLHIKYGSEKSFLKKIVLEAVSPVQNVLGSSITSVRDAWLRYILLVEIEDENKKLKKKINEIEATLISYKEGYLEAQRLRKLQSIEADLKHSLVSARVIGREKGALSRTILINKGSSDGLKSGMPVLAPPGLIGRLVDVSWHSSKVLLFIDENSNVDSIVQRNRTQGIISGAGSRGMMLRYISKNQDVQEGDVIVSSGMGGVFPKGLLIGQIKSVDRQDGGLFLKINVIPYTDLSKLEEVLVLSSEITEK